MKGGKGVYNVITFQKSRGARAHLGGANVPPPRLKETPLLKEIVYHYAQYSACVINECVSVLHTLRLQLIAGTNFSFFALRVFGIY